MKLRLFFLGSILLVVSAWGQVKLGVDVLFESKHLELLQGKRIGLVLNSSSMNSKCESTLELFKKNTEFYSLTAFFSLEHGFNGLERAGETVSHSKDGTGIPIYSLHGETRRPTREMLQNIDILIFDVQEIGSRSYTYATSLFYLMEEAVKYNVTVLVLDRPNPINGVVIDGPMLTDGFRSFRGYVNVPYCHGMTIGELAQFFNVEYKVGCDLRVIKMVNWKRTMSYVDTGLHWAPTSPYIPESSTSLFYPITGTLGELGIVNIGIGYTLPFKLIGAPWINATDFAASLNGQALPGIRFLPFHFKPFYGIYADQECNGVKIIITDPKKYRPVSTQYCILSILKSLYPKKMSQILSKVPKKRLHSFNLVNGNDEIAHLLMNQKYFAWQLIDSFDKSAQEFKVKRAKYLLY